MWSFLLHASVFVFLTLLTQIGGVAWVFSRFFTWRLVAFLPTYVALSFAAVWVAPAFGRVALSCQADGPLQVQSWMYCALNRTYMDPALRDVLNDTAEAMDQRFPGTETLVLDASFPFFDGFPLLPHLSHDDGAKVDLAFYYRDESGYLPGATRSPVGYFAFEEGPTPCAPNWPSLRWDLARLQSLWKPFALERERMRAVLQILTRDPRVGKIFVEPHLRDALGVSHPKLRFQGCRAARHDDHIHFQLQ
ncbi:MAG: hypothetical protein ACU0GG_07895 [Paracoccaceae bacterium]